MSVAFLPLLSRGCTADYKSSVINVASVAGVKKTGSGGQPSYACSKAATVHLTRILSTFFLRTGVRVQTVAPGIFPSEMTVGPSDDRGKNEAPRAAANIPMGRAGSEDEMAAALLMLVGKGGGYFNGQILYPDGGMTIYDPAVNN